MPGGKEPNIRPKTILAGPQISCCTGAGPGFPPAWKYVFEEGPICFPLSPLSGFVFAVASAKLTPPLSGTFTWRKVLLGLLPMDAKKHFRSPVSVPARVEVGFPSSLVVRDSSF